MLQKAIGKLRGFIEFVIFYEYVEKDENGNPIIYEDAMLDITPAALPPRKKGPYPSSELKLLEVKRLSAIDDKLRAGNRKVYAILTPDMKRLLRDNDEWLHHRIRAIYWKQWKKVKTKFKEFRKLGVEEEKAWTCVNMRNGNWFYSGYFVFQTALNNKKLRQIGYPTFTEFYLKICEN